MAERGSSQECGREQARTRAVGGGALGAGGTGSVQSSPPCGAAPRLGEFDMQTGQQTLRDRAAAWERQFPRQPSKWN